MLNIVLIGHFSVVGGISTHLNRLMAHLSTKFKFFIVDESPKVNFGVSLFNIRTFNFLRYLDIIKSCDCIHVHSTPFVLRSFHLFIGLIFRKKKIITIHSLTTVNNWFNLFLLRIILHFYDEVIYVSNKIKDTVKVKGVVYNAFLPPIEHYESDLPSNLKDVVFLNRAKIICSSNAYRLNVYNGIDLYGLDLILDCCLKLKNLRNNNYHFIFVIANPNFNKDLVETYKDFIYKNSLLSFITLVLNEISFVNLLLHSDVFIRPTVTDGDAISVREALHYGCNVIASDCCDRPLGVTVFKNRDSCDLFRILSNVENKKSGVIRLNNSLYNYLSPYFKIYGSAKVH